MRARNAALVRSLAGQVGSHGVRKSRLVPRRLVHASKSRISGARSSTPSPTIGGRASAKEKGRRNDISAAQARGDRVETWQFGDRADGRERRRRGEQRAADAAHILERDRV